MKVRRVLEIEGPKAWVEDVLERSYVQPNYPVVISLSDPTKVLSEVSREVIEE